MPSPAPSHVKSHNLLQGKPASTSISAAMSQQPHRQTSQTVAQPLYHQQEQEDGNNWMVLPQGLAQKQIPKVSGKVERLNHVEDHQSSIR